MKKRLIVSSVLIMMFLISLVIVFIVSDPELKIIYGVVTIIMISLALTYLFSGTAKFLIMTIYIITIILGVIFLSDYQHAVIAIGTLAIIVNPLANFEEYLEKQFNKEDILPLRISLRGKYWPFFDYRQEMRNYVHLPQTRKLFTKVWYLRARQITTITLFFTAIFLLINELKNIYIDLTNYNPVQMLTFYAVLAMFVLAFILMKSGFTAMIRVSITFTFIPIIFLINMIGLAFYSKLFLSIAITLMGIGYLIFDKINSLKIVDYNAYEYYDPADKRYVYANEFYEPFVYNETYTLVGIYRFKSDLKNFERKLKDILFYANCKHFMITAYTFNGKNIELYTEFYTKDYRKANKFIIFLEGLFSTKVDSSIYEDKYKQTYEMTFFHKTEYIVARALKLSELLDDLSIYQKELIVSIIFSFKNLEDIEALSKQYYVARMEEFDTNQYYAARVSVKTTNSKFLMEQKIRDVLLNAMIYRATYVRILVYYEGDFKHD
ncbi:hypothetical protein [Acholeplasma hippikon]|uniref:Uncharacterized protein n=1 Tax=Acholeplasma hippikon TaxID=264636 RepID=A0A449BJ91_9MOLU|nr:hypothetical protein [Acholeplasma hippikon]VEU82529.1 Uncharacterised protein [Acholeplasma hippikon]